MKILFCISLAFISMGYYMFVGQKDEIKDLTEEELQKIEETYNLVLGDTDEIISIAFSSRAVDTFILLKIKTASPEKFCANNAERFPEQHELEANPLIYCSLSYVPRGGSESIYYSKKYVYVSSWCSANEEVSELHLKIKDSREE